MIASKILMHFRHKKKSSQDIFISDPIDTDKNGNSLTLMDIMADDGNILDDIDLRLKSEQLYEYIKECLDKREQEILKMRYGLFGTAPLTQQEVAQKLNISRSYVSRIEKKAIEKLKSALNLTRVRIIIFLVK